MTKQPDQGWRDWVLSHSLPKMEEATTAGTAGFTPAPANPQPFSGPMSLAPSFDVIELLPPAATDKLRMLRQRAADAHALVPEFESIREASMARVEAENALKRLVAHPSENGFGLKPDDGQVIAAQRALDKATADFRRLQELQTARTAQWQAASGALAATETWLKSSRPSGTALEDFEGEPPELLKGEKGLLDAIENRRRRVREIKASIHTIQSAPYPSKHAKACMREIVEQLAARGTPDVSLLIEHDRREIVWPKVRVRSEVLGTERGLAFHEEIDVAGLFAFFLKPTVLSVLDALVDAEKDDPASLSHEAREKAEAELMGDLLDTERQEAFFVFQAQAQNLPVEHRADISPVALLGLQLVSTPRATEMPETSPGLSYDILQPGRR